MKSVQERYLYKPAPGSSHWWATNTLDSLGTLNAALDVGPGSGVFARLMRERGAQHIDAIEIDADTRRELSDSYENIVESHQELGSQSYDLILCLDVLEHMSNPFEFLAAISQRLNPGGHLLISLPNIAHWSVRFQLLLGFFEYTNRGLLDRTHLQFFTKKRAKSLIQSCENSSLVSYHCSIEPIELLLPNTIGESQWFAASSRFRFRFAQLFPGLMGYQHLLHFKK